MVKEVKLSKKKQGKEKKAKAEGDADAGVATDQSGRRQMAAKRIETDGWDRMKPLSADNHPPGTTWPPPS